jgi:hypothetical protein
MRPNNCLSCVDVVVVIDQGGSQVVISGRELGQVKTVLRPECCRLGI